MYRLRFSPVAVAVAAALTLAACASPASSGAGTPASSERAATLAASLDAAISDALNESGIPGAVLLVTKNGDEQWSYAFNSPTHAAAKVSLEQHFGYRSITKSFTVTALLTLVDDGAVSLDDPISSYVDGVPNGDAVTLRMLATMRSGLMNYTTMPDVGQMISNNPTGTFTNAELIDSALAAPVLFEPDAQYMYSNTNTILLGEVIARASGPGREWADVVAANVVAPLELNSIRYPADGIIPAPEALPYQWADGRLEELPVVSPSLFGSAGGLFGTVADLARWADELGTGALLEPQTQQDRLASFAPATGDPDSPEYDEYGLGIGKIGEYVGHTGNGLGFQALAMHNPKTGVSVAILLNSTTSDSDLPAHLFARMVPVLDATE